MVHRAQSEENAAPAASGGTPKQLDVAVVGAGFGGMYAVHKMREVGLSVMGFDEAGGVGGTWWWTRYPGARVDFPGGPFYCYTFSEELVREFDWPETQPHETTVRRYLNFVADKFDLRRSIQLNSKVTRVEWDDRAQAWHLETSRGERWQARFVICATGALSARNTPDIPGLDSFAGETYHTGSWPAEEVDLEGKRIGIIGTGSSGVQSTPLLAEQAAHLTVFQRTPQYVIPAGNRPIDPDVKRNARENWGEVRATMLASFLGSPLPISTRSALEDTEEQRNEMYEYWWERGTQGIALYSYGDIIADRAANETLCEFVRNKIRTIVHDPETARRLLPDYDIACKRLVLGTGYYETFNRDNVALVDLRDDPILTITPTAIETQAAEHPIDVLILATGFDALSGSLTRLNPRGRGGLALADRWSSRISTYLGVAMHGFPNMFMLNGPESPSALWNMPMAAELEADWAAQCILDMNANGFGAIEPDADAERVWGEEVFAIADRTLFTKNDSWFNGANIPGKPKQFLVHLNGPEFFARLTEVAAKNYTGFTLDKRRGGGACRSDGR